MALINCPECNREVSDTVSACPHCGYAIAEEAAGSVAPQQVEVTAIKIGNPAKTKKLAIVAAAVLVLVAAAIGIFSTIQRNNAEKEKVALRSDYVENLNKINYAMLKGAADAEQVCNLTQSVWRNTIYKNDDPDTDFITKVGGKFREDFNDSLNALYENAAIVEWVDRIKSNQSEVAEIYKLLQNPPDELSKCFDVLEGAYTAYLGLTKMAISPSGSLSSYGDDFHKYDSSFMEGYDKLKLLIPEE